MLLQSQSPLGRMGQPKAFQPGGVVRAQGGQQPDVVPMGNHLTFAEDWRLK
jgi:hypothetical protein